MSQISSSISLKTHRIMSVISSWSRRAWNVTVCLYPVNKSVMGGVERTSEDSRKDKGYQWALTEVEFPEAEWKCTPGQFEKNTESGVSIVALSLVTS